MKRAIGAMLLLAASASISASETYKMDEEAMQAMMAQMQQMQECMQKVDRTGITAAEQRAMQVAAKIKALCARGKPDQARQQAIAFSEELAKIPALQALRKCGENAIGAAPVMPLLDQYQSGNFTGYDLCGQ